MAKNPKILESVYSIRDIQIFGAGSRRMKEVDEANQNVNHASFWLTVHRQTVPHSRTSLYISPESDSRLREALTCLPRDQSSGRNDCDPFAATASLSSTFNLTFVVTSLLETYGAAERIFKIEDTMPETEEPAHPVSCGEIQTIEFSDVTFSYPGTEKKCSITLILRFGRERRSALPEHQGAGKSTILRLMLRFYAPTEGEIRINGIPLEQISFAELHQRIAFLEQDTYLFDATIAENIAIAKPGASKEEIRTAAERAGIAEFIETLPEGYQTDMGQMSARLSGGRAPENRHRTDFPARSRSLPDG
ncbi:MAG: ATP-binding cassette domain-containing protein [Fusicatenibacter saccharivorans]